MASYEEISNIFHNVADFSTEDLRLATIFDVHAYLVRYSSENHALSCNEIALGLTYQFSVEKHLNRDFLYESELDIIDRIRENYINHDSTNINSTLLKQVTRILDKNSDGNIPQCKIYKKDYPDTSEDSSNNSRYARIYYAVNTFTAEQINILRDSVSVYPYAEQTSTKDIIDGLNSMTYLHNREPYDADKYSAKKYPGSYFQNLSEITKAFSKYIYEDPYTISVLSPAERKMTGREYNKTLEKPINKISFKYCTYDENKQLCPTLAKDGSDVRTVNPVRLIWANGYYYLVTAEKGIGTSEYIYKNYRVDRMSDVVCLETAADVVPDFSVEKHKYSHPVMYSDDRRDYQKSDIIIKCDRRLINNALDTFGFNINIYTSADKSKTDLAETLTENEVLLNLGKISLLGVKMWALEYNNYCEVIHPTELRNELLADARRMLELYSD